jgi:hypothetical protein
MKRILKINSSKGSVRISTGPAGAPAVPANTPAQPRRKFSLSNLRSTTPRTADDIQRAIAQGRFAELKPDQT